MVLHNRTCSVGFLPLIPPGAVVEVLHVWKSFVLSVQIREQMPSYSTVVMENRKMWAHKILVGWEAEKNPKVKEHVGASGDGEDVSSQMNASQFARKKGNLMVVSGSLVSETVNAKCWENIQLQGLGLGLVLILAKVFFFLLVSPLLFFLLKLWLLIEFLTFDSEWHTPLQKLPHGVWWNSLEFTQAIKWRGLKHQFPPLGMLPEGERMMHLCPGERIQKKFTGRVFLEKQHLITLFLLFPFWPRLMLQESLSVPTHLMALCPGGFQTHPCACLSFPKWCFCSPGARKLPPPVANPPLLTELASRYGPLHSLPGLNLRVCFALAPSCPTGLSSRCPQT